MSDVPIDARSIVALGGGGFLKDPDNSLLDDFVLARVHDRTARRPRMCFIPTASGDDEEYIERFDDVFAARCHTSVLTLFDRSIIDLSGFLCAQDVIYVGGGSTPNMIAIWRMHGVDKALQLAWQRGVVLAGVSAGANCWFEASTTDAWGEEVGAFEDGLGFLSGSFTPHYDSQAARRPALHSLVAEGFPEGLAVGDGCAAVYAGTSLVECVGSHDAAVAFRVSRDVDGRAIETSLPVRNLALTGTS
jgi:dipeptidase E